MVAVAVMLRVAMTKVRARLTEINQGRYRDNLQVPALLR